MTHWQSLFQKLFIVFRVILNEPVLKGLQDCGTMFVHLPKGGYQKLIDLLDPKARPQI